MSRAVWKTFGRRLMLACAAMLACAQVVVVLRMLRGALERAPAMAAEAPSSGAPADGVELEPAVVEGPEPSERTSASLVLEQPDTESRAVVPAHHREEDPFVAPRCAGVSALIVTELRDAPGSVALLNDARGSSQRRVGDAFRDKRVVAIGFNPRESSPSVWLSGRDGLCQVVLFGRAPREATEPEPPTANARAAEPDASATEPARALAEVTSKIRKVSDTEFDIDRSAVDLILEQQPMLMRSVRLVPEHKDGKVLGPRLFGIRPESLLGVLGLKSGDRLDSINGFSMATPEGALKAYSRLRNTESLSVTVQRGGQPLELRYRIR